MNLGKGKDVMENKIKIIFATGNPHKLQEINAISKSSGIEFILPPEGFDPDETGLTFEENSYIKAKEAAVLSKNIALADDSGLCVEALDGAPGIHSARYAPSADERITKLLNNLADVSNRKAKFVCAMTLVDEFGNIIDKEIGECFGKIAEKPSGVNGFGYDPVFIVDGYECTMADMSEDLKNQISHRSIALAKIIKYMKSNLI